MNLKYELIVVIRSAFDLPSQKFLEPSSPYVEVDVSGIKQKTDYASELSHPVWNKQLHFNNLNEIPKRVIIQVKDTRTLLPNIVLGNYVISIDENIALTITNNNPIEIINNIINLQDATQGRLDIGVILQIDNKMEEPISNNNLYEAKLQPQENEEINQKQINLDLIVDDNQVNNDNIENASLAQNIENEHEKSSKESISLDEKLNNQVVDSSSPSILNTNNAKINNTNIVDQSQYHEITKDDFLKLSNIISELIATNYENQENEDSNNNIQKQTKETQILVLPAIVVQAKPVVIERVIEYEKPIEIHQTIIHKQISKIVEKPIIKEKHEHYFENVEYIKKKEKIVTEKFDDNNQMDLDQNEIEKLRTQRTEQYNDTTPIVYFEKQHVTLDTDIQNKPTQIYEKEIIYQQPVEIIKREIEKIKPTVIEDIRIEKEHIHQRIAPEFHIEKVEKISQDVYFQTNDEDNNNNNAASAGSAKN